MCGILFFCLYRIILLYFFLFILNDNHLFIFVLIAYLRKNLFMTKKNNATYQKNDIVYQGIFVKEITLPLVRIMSVRYIKNVCNNNVHNIESVIGAFKMEYLENNKKNARLDLRLTSQTKELLQKAATVAGLDLTAFTLSAAIEKADEVLTRRNSRILSNRDRTRFLEILKKNEPNQVLLDAVQEYKAFQND